MKKLVVLSGAGVSAESGLQTFRGAGGLWEGHRVEDVASPEAWKADPALVLEFYNQRRRQLMEARPNQAHRLISALEQHYEVTVITQNVDDLHERGGSTHVIHLHGELMKCRSEKNEHLVYPMTGWELKSGDLAEDGAQLRPHIVWFGEMVPMFETAASITTSADILVVIGTSLLVYPAAGLVHYTRNTVPVYLIDPGNVTVNRPNVTHIQKGAGEGMEELFELLGHKKNEGDSHRPR